MRLARYCWRTFSWSKFASRKFFLFLRGLILIMSTLHFVMICRRHDYLKIWSNFFDKIIIYQFITTFPICIWLRLEVVVGIKWIFYENVLKIWLFITICNCSLGEKNKVWKLFTDYFLYRWYLIFEKKIISVLYILLLLDQSLKAMEYR